MKFSEWFRQPELPPPDDEWIVAWMERTGLDTFAAAKRFAITETQAYDATMRMMRMQHTG